MTPMTEHLNISVQFGGEIGHSARIHDVARLAVIGGPFVGHRGLAD
jgi:hypothetical protein